MTFPTDIFSPRLNGCSADLGPRYRLSILSDDADIAGVMVDLNAIARDLRPRNTAQSPLLEPRLLDRLLRRLHHRWQADFSFGGYVEDRRDIWRGSYLDADSALHLGIDVNLPAKTAICLAQDATLVHAVHDACQDGGWGGVAIFSLDQPLGAVTHALYAHLARHSLRHAVGAHIRAGETVAHLGTPDENGGWYEHLHVQAMTQHAWEQTQGDITAFDGYAPLHYKNGHDLFPDPWPLLGVRRA